jgi:hypothetical protein
MFFRQTLPPNVISNFYSLVLATFTSILKCHVLQIHEKRFDSFGPSEETGSFVMDKYIGQKTAFNCFALYPGNSENGYVKSITLEDRKGNRFKSIVDSMAFYHILSLYNVPFESVLPSLSRFTLLKLRKADSA